MINEYVWKITLPDASVVLSLLNARAYTVSPWPRRSFIKVPWVRSQIFILLSSPVNLNDVSFSTQGHGNEINKYGDSNQERIVPILPAEASSLPSYEKARAMTVPLCPWNRRTVRPSCVLHSRTVLSLDPVATYVAFGWNLTTYKRNQLFTYYTVIKF